MSRPAQIVVRHGEPGDAPGLSKAAAQFFRQTYQGHMPSQDLETHVAEDFNLHRQLDELQDRNVITLIAENAGEIVGYAQVRRNPIPVSAPSNALIELWRIYLDQSSQGHGIGKLLLSNVGGAARSRSADHLWLGVWEQNHKAIAFYEKHGFSVVGSQAFCIGTETHNDLVMIGSTSAF